MLDATSSTQYRGKPMSDLARFENEVGPFRDRSLLKRAFVHRSYLNEGGAEDARAGNLRDNERLEFLGDAVIQFVVSALLFRLFPNLREGDLTTLRAALVRRATLARLAQELHLGDYLLLGHGEEESGARTRPAILCATFEAVVGALFIDRGLAAAEAFIVERMEPEVARVHARAMTKDPKSRLQEWAQSELSETPHYETVDAVGPDHDRTFTVRVSLSEKPIGVGRGRSKQAAAQQAAAQALHRFNQSAPEYVPDPELD